MKSNKEKVYDFMKLHAGGDPEKGISTVYIAETLDLQRTNVSSILNQLAGEGRIYKTNGRPVLYYVGASEENRPDCFSDLVGYEGSLKQVIPLARVAMLYPGRSLNTLILGARGTGKNRLAKKMFQFAADQKVIPEDAPYISIDCHEADREELLHDLAEYWKSTPNAVIYFDNIHFLDSKTRKQVLEYIKLSGRIHGVIVSCIDRNQLSDEFLSEFSVQLELPTLAERPLTERLEMIKQLFLKEAGKINRPLVVRGDVMRCLLLYECEANYYQLKGDIKIGCANAYVREHGSEKAIPLFLSDFSNAVRRGFLRYMLRRQEIDELVQFEQEFRFDKETMSISETTDRSLYEKIDRRASQLTETGMETEEVNMLLSAEVERSFTKYQKGLVEEVADKTQLAALVPENVICLVEKFLQKAEQELNQSPAPSVFYGLCLHINAILQENHETAELAGNQIAEMLENHKKEYMLATELAEEISRRFGRELPVEETVWLSMFLCSHSEEAVQGGKPVILFVFYGEGIATAIAKTITTMTKLDNVYAFELAYERATEETYHSLKKYIQTIHQGKGVMVIYDSCFLGEMLTELEEELGIVLRQLPAPVTTVGIELARRTINEDSIDKILRQSGKKLGSVGIYNRNYIVTLCSTGQGGAEELKRYIERYGQLKDTDVVAMSFADRDVLREEFKKLMQKGLITCVVGTFDPGLFSIPFISFSEVFRIKKESLPKLLSLEKAAKAGIDYNAMFEYLGEQLKNTNTEKLQKVLPAALKEINEEIAELSLDTEAGLLVHIACCIDRLIGKEPTAVNTRKRMILSKYETEFKQLLKIFKPLEKAFRIIIPEDEFANILTVIYQI